MLSEKPFRRGDYYVSSPQLSKKRLRIGRDSWYMQCLISFCLAGQPGSDEAAEATTMVGCHAATQV